MAWGVFLLAAGLYLTTNSTARGATLRVPSDFPSIHLAIDASSVGDTALVAPGTYFEAIIIPHRLVLLSEGGPEVTTIDAGAHGPVVLIALQQAEGAVVSGFRIRNGYGSSGVHAGGIHSEVNVIIKNNIVEHNWSFGLAGGVYAAAGSTVEDNIIQFNNRSAGKATSALEATGVIRRNIIRYNGDLGDLNIVFIGGPSIVEGNVIADNASATISVLTVSGGAGTIVRYNTIANNGCGLHTVRIHGGSGFVFSHNLISRNGFCGGLSCAFVGGVPDIQCNNVHGSLGSSYSDDCADLEGINGNISEPPLFCDPLLGDYRLQAGSPCAPPNSPPGCGLIGALPVCATSAVSDGGVPSAEITLRVASNPTAAAVDLILSEGVEGATIEIYDSAGRLVDVLHPAGTRAQWARAELSPCGVYFARLTNGVASAVVKFILVR